MASYAPQKWYLHLDDDTTHQKNTLHDTTTPTLVCGYLGTKKVWLGTDQNMPTYIEPKKCVASYVPRIGIYT